VSIRVERSDLLDMLPRERSTLGLEKMRQLKLERGRG